MPTWDEAKRKRNVRIHGLEFVGAEAIWDGPTVSRDDRRKDYGEKRLVTFGLLDTGVVVLVPLNATTACTSSRQASGEI